ncbi:Glycosyltransferase, GT2 family [Streptomyces sp. Termitarium-T10T-6]|nr:Glycosyltransferase, GT2 family [Streptomyces sp. Termitarium-T10T-6]
MSAPRIGVSIVTMGDRPQAVEALLASVAMQDVRPTRLVIIGNGTALPDYSSTPGLEDLDGGVTTIELPENLGCPGGRNEGLRRLAEIGDVDVVIELDDDGLLVDKDVFRRVRDRFAAEDRLGIIGFRIADETGETQRRHVPRLRAGDPMRGGPVTAFLGGGHAFSMKMLAETGLWPAEFFFTHEETDLAWRALDAGWKVEYDPELLLQHPKTSPARHAVYYRMTARNRVWLARRNLPLPLVPAYLGTWTLLTLARTRDPKGLRAWAGGFAEGVRTPVRGAAPDALVHGVADDAAGPPAGHLSHRRGVQRYSTSGSFSSFAAPVVERDRAEPVPLVEGTGGGVALEHVQMDRPVHGPAHLGQQPAPDAPPQRVGPQIEMIELVTPGESGEAEQRPALPGLSALPRRFGHPHRGAGGQHDMGDPGEGVRVAVDPGQPGHGGGAGVQEDPHDGLRVPGRRRAQPYPLVLGRHPCHSLTPVTPSPLRSITADQNTARASAQVEYPRGGPP